MTKPLREAIDHKRRHPRVVEMNHVHGRGRRGGLRLSLGENRERDAERKGRSRPRQKVNVARRLTGMRTGRHESPRKTGEKPRRKSDFTVTRRVRRIPGRAAVTFRQIVFYAVVLERSKFEWRLWPL